MEPSAWVNWSGGLRFRPAEVAAPRNQAEVVEVVERARGVGRQVRVVGSGHSSYPLVETDDLLVSTEHLAGVVNHDLGRGEARIRAGTSLRRIGRDLLEAGLAMENLGDIDEQSLAGAIGTGTHGTGARLGNLATQVLGVRLVTANDGVVDWDVESDRDRLRAARVSLGLLGIVSELRLRVVPAYRLHRREWCLPIGACLARLDELVAGHRHLDFYWYPRRDDVKVRSLQLTDRVDARDVRSERGVRHAVGWSSEIIPHVRELRFHEMEYAVPAAAGPECFAEIRRRILQRHRKEVAWRVLYRTVAGDDAYLSPAFGRDTVTISLHQNATLPYQAYFSDIEPIFWAYGGRPHWAKLHSLVGQQLLDLYPQAHRFLAMRDACDPEGLFLTDQLSQLLALRPRDRERRQRRGETPR